MKKNLIVLIMAMVAVLLIVSCEPEPKMYTVTFDVEGNKTAVETQTVEEGSKATKPSNPTHVGWGFLRWSTTKDGETAFDFDKDTITADTTLYAVWKKSYIIGDKGPAGGWIFYDCDADNNSATNDGLTSEKCGWRYLEAASADLAEQYAFGLYNKDGSASSVGTSADIGKGKENTEKLIEAMGETAFNGNDNKKHAAQACADYGNDTDYDDWFLPSSNELKLVYENLAKQNLGGTWQTDEYSGRYWSSTDINAYPHMYAHIVKFATGEVASESRYNSYYVRPVRSF